MGTMGHAIFVAARTGNLSELGPMVKTYQAAWKAAGHPGKGGVFLRVPVYVAETEQRAREEPRESILHLLRTIGSRLAESAKLESARAIEKRGERGAKMVSIEYDEVLRERMIVGTPPQVIDRLKQVQEELGLDGILAELNPGSLIPHPQVMTALRLLCEQVIPAFK
jgi:alkanesulfonate monooxygenase SsuD/methylene tetrahydromethanopterin reductase-like flavin-dependent oxidoreductase (luciferase family)